MEVALDGLIIEHGARFLVGAPHPSATAAGFAQALSGNAAVRKALAGSRWRLLNTIAHEELDRDGDRDHCRECEAIYYDYTRNRTVRVRGKSANARGLQVAFTHEQPVPSPEEFEEAVELVRQSEVWGPMLRAGQVHPYGTMPPVLYPKGNEPVERTLYVGLVSRARQFNRMVAVNMVRREVSREAVVPDGNRVQAPVCGVEDAPCFSPQRGTPGTVTIQWPANAPVWSFQAVRPASSSGLLGSGIDLRNVKYRGKGVLKQAHIPILNVEYEDNVCGPFRDWLFQENCFRAVGSDIPGAPGFRWCTEPPQTIIESGQDGGSFTGVAVYEHSDGSLRLVTQCSAGWYRYIMEWRFYPDGTLAPRFRFHSTDSFCVCNARRHHVYWRLDFNVCGKKNRVQELTGDSWKLLKRETAQLRAEDGSPRWRVLHQKKPIGYEIVPGEHDGVGDFFSGNDQYLLRYRKKEIDDSKNGNIITIAPANIQRFVKREKVNRADLVVWYAAHYDFRAGNDPAQSEVGPDLVPFNWPAGR